MVTVRNDFACDESISVDELTDAAMYWVELCLQFEFDGIACQCQCEQHEKREISHFEF